MHTWLRSHRDVLSDGGRLWLLKSPGIPVDSEYAQAYLPDPLGKENLGGTCTFEIIAR